MFAKAARYVCTGQGSGECNYQIESQSAQQFYICPAEDIRTVDVTDELDELQDGFDTEYDKNET